MRPGGRVDDAWLACPVKLETPQHSGPVLESLTELEAKLAKKDEVLGEVMEEYVALKKSRGAS